MKHIKHINNLGNSESLDENAKSKAVRVIADLGKHATLAMVQYLSDNPELISDMWAKLKDSAESSTKVQNAITDLD